MTKTLLSILKYLLWLLILLPIAASARPVHLSHLQVNILAKRHWQIIFRANRPIHYHSFTLLKPFRVVVDVKNGQFRRRFSQELLRATPVMDIRTGKQPNNRLRIVLDLEQDVKVKVFARPSKISKRSYHLVIDLKGKAPRMLTFGWRKQRKTPAVSPRTKVIKAPPKRASATHSTTPLTLKFPDIKPNGYVPKIRRYSKNIVILIDPGHGGKDPGATGPRGIHEKNVVLAISKKLARLINKQPGFSALLTRHGDYYLYLRQRLAIARRDHADMFIAIHADAYRDRSAQGASVFALSRRGATSEAARWLAERENKSELMGGVELSDKSHLLKSVLINLSQTATISASLKIGDDIINVLRRVVLLHHSRVEQAAFVVLKSPDIPSLLVETGFITNPHEERRLSSSSYQWKLARSIEQGIVRYYRNHPPRGTWLAEWRYQGGRRRATHQRRYRVRRGDTLSAIAAKFATSVGQLKQINHLHNNRIEIGDRLKIPG